MVALEELWRDLWASGRAWNLRWGWVVVPLSGFVGFVAGLLISSVVMVEEAVDALRTWCRCDQASRDFALAGARKLTMT